MYRKCQQCKKFISIDRWICKECEKDITIPVVRKYNREIGNNFKSIPNYISKNQKDKWLRLKLVEYKEKYKGNLTKKEYNNKKN